MQTATYLVFFGFIASLWLSVDSNPIEENPEKPPCADPFQEFRKLIPFEKVDQIVQSHLANDTGFRAAVKVLQNDSWLQLMEKVEDTPEFKKFSEVAEKYNFNVTKAISYIIGRIKSLDTVPFDKEVPDGSTEPEPNLESFATEMQQALPFDKFAKLLPAENPDFKKIREELATEENRQIALALHNAPEMVELRKSLKTMHFDVQPYISLMYNVLGWQLPE